MRLHRKMFFFLKKKINRKMFYDTAFHVIELQAYFVGLLLVIIK